MSDNKVTQNPNDGQAPGKPLDPNVIVPEDDAGLEEDQEDVDETIGGGMTKIGGGDPNKRKIA